MVRRNSDNCVNKPPSLERISGIVPITPGQGITSETLPEGVTTISDFIELTRNPALNQILPGFLVIPTSVGEDFIFIPLDINRQPFIPITGVPIVNPANIPPNPSIPGFVSIPNDQNPLEFVTFTPTIPNQLQPTNNEIIANPEVISVPTNIPGTNIINPPSNINGIFVPGIPGTFFPNNSTFTPNTELISIDTPIQNPLIERPDIFIPLAQTPITTPNPARLPVTPVAGVLIPSPSRPITPINRIPLSNREEITNISLTEIITSSIVFADSPPNNNNPDPNQPNNNNPDPNQPNNNNPPTSNQQGQPTFAEQPNQPINPDTPLSPNQPINPVTLNLPNQQINQNPNNQFIPSNTNTNTNLQASPATDANNPDNIGIFIPSNPGIPPWIPNIPTIPQFNNPLLPSQIPVNPDNQSTSTRPRIISPNRIPQFDLSARVVQSDITVTPADESGEITIDSKAWPTQVRLNIAALRGLVGAFKAAINFISVSKTYMPYIIKQMESQGDNVGHKLVMIKRETLEAHIYNSIRVAENLVGQFKSDNDFYKNLWEKIYDYTGSYKDTQEKTRETYQNGIAVSEINNNHLTKGNNLHFVHGRDIHQASHFINLATSEISNYAPILKNIVETIEQQSLTNRTTSDEIERNSRTEINRTEDRQELISNRFSHISRSNDWRTISSMRQVKQSETSLVGSNYISEIGQNMSRTIGNNETTIIGSAQTNSIKTTQTNTIGTDQINSIGAKQTNYIGDTQVITIEGDQNLKVGGQQEISVGSQTTQINGNRRTSASQNTESYSSSEEYAGTRSQSAIDHAINVSNLFTVSSNGDLIIQATGKIIIRSNETLSLIGNFITMNRQWYGRRADDFDISAAGGPGAIFSSPETVVQLPNVEPQLQDITIPEVDEYELQNYYERQILQPSSATGAGGGATPPDPGNNVPPNTGGEGNLKTNHSPIGVDKGLYRG